MAVQHVLFPCALSTIQSAVCADLQAAHVRLWEAEEVLFLAAKEFIMANPKYATCFPAFCSISVNMHIARHVHVYQLPAAENVETSSL